MAAVKKRKFHVPRINLVPRDPFYDSAIGKVMVWATKIGRYIIIFTEIIVIMSFASRFKLDRDLTDLTAATTQKSAIIASFGDVETKTRTIQSKIENTQKILDDPQAAALIVLLTAKIPPDVELDQLSFETTGLALAGRANSSTGFAQLLTALQNEPRFNQLTVDKISSGDSKEQGVLFSVHILFAAPKTAATPKPTATEAPAI
ncbi:MAG TPA: PilN domain-containing protein [Patescibacteria group bacterium]|nr:PilN domain-containing protein [Patescibacteria group bacterium]